MLREYGVRRCDLERGFLGGKLPFVIFILYKDRQSCSPGCPAVSPLRDGKRRNIKGERKMVVPWGGCPAGLFRDQLRLPHLQTIRRLPNVGRINLFLDLYFGDNVNKTPLEASPGCGEWQCVWGTCRTVGSHGAAKYRFSAKSV